MCRMGSKVRWTTSRRRGGGQRVEGGRVALDADVKRRRKSPFLGIAASSAVHLNARDTTMDMYDEPNPDRFDAGGSGGPPLGEAWRRCCDRLRAEVGDAVFNSWFGSLTLEVGRIGAGPAFRSDALSQKLDRNPLLRACRFGAERRSWAGRANPYFRALVGAARAAAQMRADRLRLARRRRRPSRSSPPLDRAPAERRAPSRTPARLRLATP